MHNFLFVINGIELRWLDVVDFLLVALLVYQLYLLVRGTVAIRIFVGLFAILLVWRITVALQMQLIASILGQFIGVGALSLVIIFQPELRKLLMRIGSSNWFQRSKILSEIPLFSSNIDAQYKELFKREIPKTVFHFSSKKIGALLVFSRSSNLNNIIETGKKIDAKLSATLLESIFVKESPLHDGAVIIDEGRIAAASCILPLSENKNLPFFFGTRHRAAIGISEQSDAFCILVSEENGRIHWVEQGNYTKIASIEELQNKLNDALNIV